MHVVRSFTVDPNSNNMAEEVAVAPLLLEIEQCLEAVTSVVSSGPTESQVHGIVQYLEQVLEAVSMVETSLPALELASFQDAMMELIACLQSSITPVATDFYPLTTNTTAATRTTHLDISSQHLAFLIECDFTLKEIASFFNCSSKTIQRRIAEFGLQGISAYSDISQADLDDITGLYVQSHPRAGYKSFQAFLTSQGLKVQRHFVRNSMLRVDPH